MPDRSSIGQTAARALNIALDVALFSPRSHQLAVLLVPATSGRGRARDRWSLPTDSLRKDESLDEAAARIARESLGAAPSLLEQAVALGGARRYAEGPSVRVTYFGLVPDRGTTRTALAWNALGDVPALPARQRDGIEAALAAMRARVDLQPIAFRLLPTSFTLTELQAVYELLLGRRLHKASFRRALHSSALVDATEEWRSEGRGRPAQLYRYAPPRRRRQRRGIRFDLLS